MNLKILGTRGEVKESAPGYSKHSGVLIDGQILLDLGEKEYLNYRPKAVFITHLHPDHAFFIRGPALIDIPVYAPEVHKNAKIEVPSGPVTIGAYRVTPFPTIHSKKFRSQGYVVEKEDRKLVYTGDLIRINKKHHHLLENANLVITDGSHLRKGGRVFRDKETGQIYGHTGIPDLINFFKAFTANILFLHFGSWFYEDVSVSVKRIKELGKERSVRVVAAYDGLELNLSNLPHRKASKEAKETKETTLDRWLSPNRS
ncbi:MAG TPA: MBL fold metallo-hydrolase [Methanotrichaceae archaeon]|nr:MBL fold metallo-hydrolase [Methanotrichaceae archaeon]